jgi:hypothetical protein
MFQTWTQASHRPTRDLDLLGRSNSALEHCQEAFRKICRIPVDNEGLIFSAETVSVGKVKEERDYEGVQVQFLVRLAGARVPVQVDVGFGDEVTPGFLDYPTLWPMPAPRIHAYHIETVVAEKTEALIRLSMLNSRMKDFYDI